MRRLQIAVFCSMLNTACVVPEVPPYLNPRVEIGHGLAVKELIFSSKDIGGISDLSLYEEATDGTAIVVAGTQAAAFLDPNSFRVKRLVPFNDGSPPFSPHVIVKTENGIGFLRQPSSGTTASFHDDRGQLIWEGSPPGRGFPNVSYGAWTGREGCHFSSGVFPPTRFRFGIPMVIWSGLRSGTEA